MDLSGSSEVSPADVSVSVSDAPKRAKAAKPARDTDSRSVKPLVYPVEVDHSRDALLTEFGKDTLQDRYLLPGETFQDLFVRVASAYADDAGHAQRLYDYISKLWFMPATPVLSNGGTGRGLPISCYLNSVQRQPRGHCRDVERKRVARRTRWRHRHLLGQCPRHRRGGRPQRQDQRHHPLRAGDGQPDAGHQPGLAAPRLGRLLSRYLAPGDRGVPRDPQALGRLQPQGAEPAPWRARLRRLHGGGARRRANGRCRARRTAPSAARSTPAASSRSWSRPGSRPASPTSSSSTR